MEGGGNKDIEWIYDCILQIVKSPEFRNPIKDFMDDNCDSFLGEEENTFEQGDLHKKFIELVDNLLATLTKDIGITDEMFCLAAKKGLEDEKSKKYFEQLISFTNYNYFKNLMTKRNYYLEELVFKEMMKDKEKDGDELTEEEKKELEGKAKEIEDKELECALKMSLAIEEEKKKLKELEDAELEKAILLSLKEEYAKKNPSPLVQMNPNNKKIENPYKKEREEKEKQKKIEKEMEEIEKEKKLNPIDKVALKQKMLQEHDEKMQTILSTNEQPQPTFNVKNNETLNKKLNEFEESKNQKFQQYRESILKMKKEKRQKEENEVDDLLGGEQKKSNGDENRITLRKQLAEKLKSRAFIKK